MNVKRIINLGLAALLMVQVLFCAQAVFADTPAPVDSGVTAGPVLAPEQSTSLINPLCPSGTCAGAKTYDPRNLLGQIINSALGIIGAIALVLFMWGGLQIMLSRGNSEELKRGKGTMLWAVIGLLIIFSSYALVQYVISNVSKIPAPVK